MDGLIKPHMIGPSNVFLVISCGFLVAARITLRLRRLFASEREPKWGYTGFASGFAE